MRASGATSHALWLLFLLFVSVELAPSLCLASPNAVLTISKSHTTSKSPPNKVRGGGLHLHLNICTWSTSVHMESAFLFFLFLFKFSAVSITPSLPSSKKPHLSWYPRKSNQQVYLIHLSSRALDTMSLLKMTPISSHPQCPVSWSFWMACTQLTYLAPLRPSKGFTEMDSCCSRYKALWKLKLKHIILQEKRSTNKKQSR